MRPTRRAHDTEAVSAVISVVLTVALTVILAATVVLLIRGPADQDIRAAEFVQFQADRDGGRLVVLAATEHADWSRVALRAAGLTPEHATVHMAGDDLPRINEPARPGTQNLLAPGQPLPVAALPIPITTGDWLGLCALEPAVRLDLLVLDRVAEALIGQYAFPVLPVCP